MKTRVLVMDEQDGFRKQLQNMLDRESVEVAVASNASEAHGTFGSGPEIGVLVTSHFGLMSWTRENHPGVRVIIVAQQGGNNDSLKALRAGASDYVEQPLNMGELTQTVIRCLREFNSDREKREHMERLESRVERVEGRSDDRYWFVSKAHSMARVNEWITILRRDAMRGDSEEPAVLLLGESGTGKEGIARMIHTGSRRGKGPWIAVNCASFSEQQLEAELFGHEKGAFAGATSRKRGLFEIARGGTLFLDEVSEIGTKLQAKLLRAVQERVIRRVGGSVDIEADVRVISASHHSLQPRIQDGQFLSELFHQLARVQIEVPALRSRSEDLLPMAQQFAEHAFRGRGKKFEGFSPESESALITYAWPGNVRELLNVIERTALIWDGSGRITLKALGIPSENGSSSAPLRLEVIKSPYGVSNEETLQSFTELKKKWSDSFEREYLIAALARHGGNVSYAAREAKLDRSNFLRLLRRHGLKASTYRASNRAKIAA